MSRPTDFTQEIAEIYALCCPLTGEVRYVGKAMNARKRFAGHMRDANRRMTLVYLWIRTLHERGAAPILRVLERVHIEDWERREREHIAQFRTLGPLLNMADGGNEPKCDYTTRAANGRATSAKRREYSETEARLYRNKRFIGAAYRAYLKAGDLIRAERLRQRMVAQARAYPHLFGCWSAL
jgi:hypothetical protein